MCRFCGIAAGEVAAHVVFEDDTVVAFLDHRPVFHGHTLVIPREHLETLSDVPSPLLGELFPAVQRITDAVVAAMGAAGSFVACNNKVSQSVPHLHVHVVPRRFKDGLRGFFWPRHEYAGEAEMEAVASAIRDALAQTTSR
jgi:histidine triad (HIT) family protein